ncbi:MAG TPA: sialate O-acetylesterase, partial [Salinimicrobium sp.]|nr:sialate O-acetylesterase [Salinimicrobium sp.]
MKKAIQLLILFFGLPAFAQISVADIFTDNMIFQRNEPILIWGKAVPNQLVEVKFDDETYRTIVAADSTWIVSMQKQPANANPQSLLIRSGNEEIKLDNILIGDVWLLIGQSNMEFPMQGEMHFEEALKHANNPMLRFYNPTYIGKNVYGVPYSEEMLKSLGKADYYSEALWQESNPSSIKTMSAVGYYFGKEIVER